MIASVVGAQWHVERQRVVLRHSTAGDKLAAHHQITRIVHAVVVVVVDPYADEHRLSGGVRDWKIEHPAAPKRHCRGHHHIFVVGATHVISIGNRVRRSCIRVIGIRDVRAQTHPVVDGGPRTCNIRRDTFYRPCDVVVTIVLVAVSHTAATCDQTSRSIKTRPRVGSRLCDGVGKAVCT